MSTPSRQLISVSELLFDLKNPRLKQQPPNQQEAIVAVAEQQGRRLLALADDIAQKGVDPISLTAVVPAEEGSGDRYVVLEGNRRLAAIKAAETPALVEDVYTGREWKRLQNIHDRFLKNPTAEIECVVFDTEEDARWWVELRHTGPRKGEGLYQWDSLQKDRYRRRHGSPSPAGEMIDFVRNAGGLSEKAQESTKGILTNVRRLLSTKEVRDILGVEKRRGELYSHFPPEEVAKGLTRVIEDLLTEQIKVQDIYEKEQRIEYANNLPKEVLPNPAKRLDEPEPLKELGDVDLSGKKKRRRRDRSRERKGLIPRDLVLEIQPNRIHDIYAELKKMPLATYTNAISVLFRVFLEMSVNRYIDDHDIPASNNLAKRMKDAADHLEKAGKLTENARRAVREAAENKLGIASTVTFNQYVHNEHVFPEERALRDAWDQLQPFLKQLWPPSEK